MAKLIVFTTILVAANYGLMAHFTKPPDYTFKSYLTDIGIRSSQAKIRFEDHFFHRKARFENQRGIKESKVGFFGKWFE